MTGHTHEKKRHERGARAEGDFTEGTFESPRVIVAVVGGHAHAGDEDSSAVGPQSLHDLCEVRLHGADAQAAQAVVGAERDDDDLGSRAKHPVDAPQARRARVAAHAGIDHAVAVALSVKARLQPRGKGVAGRHPKTGGEAVAEHRDDGVGADGARDGGRKQREHQREDGGEAGGHSVECSMALMILQVRDLSMRLGGGGRPVAILDAVSFEVARGEVVAVTGPSGSGKSTLLGLIAGLDTPTAGSIVVDDVDVTVLGESALARFRRHTIGYVFQSYHLIPTLSALENVAVPLELAAERAALPRAAALLADVGLADRVHHYPAQLSGGEQQRVAIARAMALRPALVLADEPTGNLDSATGAAIIDLLLALNSEHGATLLLVTHDAALAQRAHRVIRLRDGRIVRERKPTSVS